MADIVLESSKDFVNRYIIVDKNGETLPIINITADILDLNVETFVKPSLSLKEARLFAIEKTDEPWILIQDGDEVFHTDGPYAITNLRYHMNRPNVFFCTRMTMLKGDFKHTRPKRQIQPFHKFLYHNNGTLGSKFPNENLPNARAWRIDLDGIWKFNCVIKHPKRMYLRTFWDQWCKNNDYYKEYPNIEDYVSEELGIDVEDEYKEWYSDMFDSLIPYDEKRLGTYPEVIRRRLN